MNMNYMRLTHLSRIKTFTKKKKKKKSSENQTKIIFIEI
jgi:hypothetical protein